MNEESGSHFPLPMELKKRRIMSPQPKGGGAYCFCCRSASALLRFRALSFESMEGF